MRNTENHLEFSKMPTGAQASQEATAQRSVAMVVKTQLGLSDRHEQKDLQGLRHLAMLEHSLSGIVLRGR